MERVLYNSFGIKTMNHYEYKDCTTEKMGLYNLISKKNNTNLLTTKTSVYTSERECQSGTEFMESCCFTMHPDDGDGLRYFRSIIQQKTNLNSSYNFWLKLPWKVRKSYLTLGEIKHINFFWISRKVKAKKLIFLIYFLINK